MPLMLSIAVCRSVIDKLQHVRTFGLSLDFSVDLTPSRLVFTPSSAACTLVLPPVNVEGLVSAESDILNSFTDWHSALDPEVVADDVVVDELPELDFELEPQPVRAGTRR